MAGELSSAMRYAVLQDRLGVRSLKVQRLWHQAKLAGSLGRELDTGTYDELLKEISQLDADIARIGELLERLLRDAGAA